MLHPQALGYPYELVYINTAFVYPALSYNFWTLDVFRWLENKWTLGSSPIWNWNQLPFHLINHLNDIFFKSCGEIEGALINWTIIVKMEWSSIKLLHQLGIGLSSRGSNLLLLCSSLRALLQTQSVWLGRIKKRGRLRASFFAELANWHVRQTARSHCLYYQLYISSI